MFDISSVEVLDSKISYVDASRAIPGFKEQVYLAWKAGWVVVDMVPKS